MLADQKVQATDMKICSYCFCEKPKINFHKNNKNKDGLQSRCKECSTSAVKKWQQDYPDKVNIKNAIWKKTNKIWLTPKAKTYTRERSARRRTQTPKWADRDLILNFYLCCPEKCHVDHIIPLKGKFVSGLHVLNNLQYLPAQENLQKGNRY